VDTDESQFDGAAALKFWPDEFRPDDDATDSSDRPRTGYAS